MILDSYGCIGTTENTLIQRVMVIILSTLTVRLECYEYYFWFAWDKINTFRFVWDKNQYIPFVMG